MKTITLKQHESSETGFEIVSNENNEVVFRKMLLYEPSKKYKETLTTVTFKSFTEQQLKELNEQKEEIYKRLAELKKEQNIKQDKPIFQFFTAFKHFLME